MSDPIGIADYEYSRDMPPMKKRRFSKNYGKRNRKQSVPTAIRTRGTPAGYYEIPVRQLIKIFTNTSSGFWSTNQTTGASIGLTGYRGIGMNFALDNSTIQLGEGAFSANISSAVPGFAELQAVFDMCKIVDIEIECWWTNQHSELTTGTTYGGMDLFLAEDPNNDDPPGSIATVMQYQNVKRYVCDSNKKLNYKIKPHMRISAGTTDDEAGTASSIAVTAPSSYVQTAKPAVCHFGFRGWLDIPTAAAARTGTLNILVKQTRRYKMSR